MYTRSPKRCWLAAAALFAVLGCRTETTTKDHAAVDEHRSSEPPDRPGLALAPVKGTKVEIAELTARPTLSVLSGVDDVQFPGESEVGDNTLEVRFALEAGAKMKRGRALVAKHVCQHGEHVLASRQEILLRVDGEKKPVPADRMKKGARGRGSSVAAPIAPELGDATACEVSFFLESREGGGERTELGRVCAIGGTRLKRKRCSDTEIKRPALVGSPVAVSEPVGRVTQEGAAGWYLVTAHQALAADQRLWTTLVCRDGQKSETRTFSHEELRLEHLEPGESAMATFGMSQLKWLTRESGRCEVGIGVSSSPNTGEIGRYCLTQGRTSKGACSS